MYPSIRQNEDPQVPKESEPNHFHAFFTQQRQHQLVRQKSCNVVVIFCCENCDTSSFKGKTVLKRISSWKMHFTLTWGPLCRIATHKEKTWPTIKISLGGGNTSCCHDIFRVCPIEWCPIEWRDNFNKWTSWGVSEHNREATKEQKALGKASGMFSIRTGSYLVCDKRSRSIDIVRLFVVFFPVFNGQIASWAWLKWNQKREAPMQVPSQ